MNSTVITPPAFEPVTLEEAKSWLRVDTNADDSLIEALIVAAREYVEHYANTAFAERTVEFSGEPYTLNLAAGTGPLAEVLEVRTATTALTTDDYRLETLFEYDGIYLHRMNPETVTVRAKVGRAKTVEEVPAVVKVAMQLLITDNYEKRSDRIRKMPTAAENLLNPVRRWV